MNRLKKFLLWLGCLMSGQICDRFLFGADRPMTRPTILIIAAVCLGVAAAWRKCFSEKAMRLFRQSDNFVH